MARHWREFCPINALVISPPLDGGIKSVDETATDWSDAVACRFHIAQTNDLCH
jgi:hypothetical protein